MDLRRGKDYIGVGVGTVILNDSDEILLLKRRRPPESGHWTIPGGGVNFGEPVVAAIKRETKEELGVEIAVERLLRVTDHLLPDEGVHWVAIAFAGRIQSGEPSNLEPEVHECFKWYSLAELPTQLTKATAAAILSLKTGNQFGA